jgi:cysteine desulfurase family protein (TIGR01976 family)
LNNKLNIDYVRSQFPGLSNGWTYFDNAGGSQVLSVVVDRLNDFLYNRNAQTGGTYDTSIKAAQSVQEGREAMAAFVNAARAEEIVFASSTTLAFQLLAKSLRGQLRCGDEIVVTSCDHETNIGPWLALEQYGLKIHFWDLNKETLELDLSELESLMNKRTKLVAVTYVSNILGTINPIKEIAALVHKNNALICVDAVAYAPHRAIDVQDLDVDFLAFSTYKTYGPHYSVLYGKYEKLLDLDVIYHYFHGKKEIPRKLEPGNANYELSYSLTGIVDYFERLGEFADCEGSTRDKIVAGFHTVAEHESELCERLLSYLRQRGDCRIFGLTDGTDPRRVPTISFRIDGKDPGDVARSVEKYRLAIRYGDFYARRLTDFLGLTEKNGVVRVSMVHYNTIKEVDSLIDSLEREL